jgi:hypothetical protein
VQGHVVEVIVSEHTRKQGECVCDRERERERGGRELEIGLEFVIQFRQGLAVLRNETRGG